MAAREQPAEATDDCRRRPPQARSAPAAGRRYRAPQLTRYGRLVDVTLGGSPGAGDSGGGVLIENPLA